MERVEVKELRGWKVMHFEKRRKFLKKLKGMDRIEIRTKRVEARIQMATLLNILVHVHYPEQTPIARFMLSTTPHMREVSIM